MAKEVYNYIPDDIIVNLLSYLPAKSLLRFRVVCKTWYYLISDPKFIEFHSKRPSQNPNLIFSTAASTIRLLDYESSSSSLSRPLSFPVERCSSSFPIRRIVVGSSCGLVCVASGDDSHVRFSVWNPVTRECRVLPPNRPPSDNHTATYLHGFAYDSVTNDFTLVIHYFRYGSFIYSLKQECWVLLLGIPYNIDPEFPLLYATYPASTLATFLNGSFHWLVFPAFDHPPQIIALNCAQRRWRKLEMPGFVPFQRAGGVSLLEHRGCLCLYFSNCNRSGKFAKEIWMMKEYGDITSWVHLLRIENSGLPLGSSVFDFYSAPVLFISTRNQVVLRISDMFLRSRREEEDKFKFDGVSILSDVNGAALYVDSLIRIPYPIHASY